LGQPSRQKISSEATKWNFEHGLVKRTGFCLRLPRDQLVDGEEDEDVAYVYAFARRAVVLLLQVRTKFDEH
jgi:glutathione peroxidase-family protein